MSKNSRAQIVATVGPACAKLETIEEMIKHHVDAVRLNFSWGTHDDHAGYIKLVRKAAKNQNRRIPIIQDLSGPRLQKGRRHFFDENRKTVITEKDLRDLKFGLSQEVDYVALSFVGGSEDVSELKAHILKLGKKTPVIAKIEREKALENLSEIIETADAVMIARGDLSNEVPLGEIPFIEKDIISKAKKAGKPVITATQMLLSMKDNPRPTRAEVTDVSYAITIGSDAVMLSEETAAGKYPVEAVTAMEKIILEAEKHQPSAKINSL